MSSASGRRTTGKILLLPFLTKPKKLCRVSNPSQEEGDVISRFVLMFSGQETWSVF
jgi:hypothetical protein